MILHELIDYGTLKLIWWLLLGVLLLGVRVLPGLWCPQAMVLLFIHNQWC